MNRREREKTSEMPIENEVFCAQVFVYVSNVFCYIVCESNVNSTHRLNSTLQLCIQRERKKIIH